MTSRGWIAIACVTVVAGTAVPEGRAAEDHSRQRRAGLNWTGRDLTGANCEETDFNNTNLSSVNFTAANLRNADLTRAVLDGANLTGADLRGAKFSNTFLRDANCTMVKLEGTKFDYNTVTTGVSFVMADLRGISGLSQITRCDFTNADLRGANLRIAVDWTPGSAKFRGAQYDDETVWPKEFDLAASGAVKARPEDGPKPAADGGLFQDVAAQRPARAPVGTGRQMAGVDKRANDLQGKNFDDANLEGAIFFGAQLQEATFRRANLRGADLRDARLDSVDFVAADLRGANLAGAHLTRTSFADAVLSEVDLSKAWGISDVKFFRTDLRGASLAHPTITGCSFQGADLRGALVAGPAAGYYTTSDYRGAIYDRTTRWPKGFDPAAAGAVLRADPRDAHAFDQTDEDVPPRLLAPDRDPASPSEAVVKRLFVAKLEQFRGGLMVEAVKMIAGQGFGGLNASSTAFTVELTKMTYLPPEKVFKSGKDIIQYPIQIGGNLVFEASDGSEYRAPFDWRVPAFDGGNGKWDLVLPEGKGN